MNTTVTENSQSEKVSPVTAEKIISVKNLEISFGKQDVLKDVSFDMYAGENLVVLGRSGSGKSVLIKCISCLLKPDGGTIDVFGERVNDMNSEELANLRKKLGFLFQSGALYDSMTVKENLEFPLTRMNRRITKSEMTEKVNEALENVGLADALNKMPSELSGGMRKRIALARTLVVDPQIMLYDEPTTGLDPITSFEISELINKVQRKYHTSSIVITHDMPCAKEVANRIIFLKDGEIKAEGDYTTLSGSEDPWIKSFFGTNTD